MSENKPASRILKIKSVLGRIPLSRSTIFRLEREGRFPKRIHMGGMRVCGWLEAEIEAWIVENYERSNLSTNARQV